MVPSFFLLMQKPAVTRGIKADRFQARELLLIVNQLAGGVLARHHVVNLEPRIEHRHRCRVGNQPHT